MTRGFRAVLLAGVAAGLVPAMLPVAATAQSARNLDNARSDVLIFDGAVTSAPAVFRYTMQPNTTLQVDVIPKEGSDLDPVLTITDARTGEVLAEDDDSGGNLASRARIVTEARRQVEITVSAFAFFSGEETSGPFELQLRPTAFVPEPTTAVEFGSEMRGRLTGGNPRLYTIRGEAGQLLEVALTARGDDLDPLLILYRGHGTMGEEVARDDDGGEGLNSLLRVRLPESGTYTIAASAYNSSEGQFSLRVAPLRELAAATSEQVLGFGEALEGYITQANYGDYDGEDSYVTFRLGAEAIAAIRAGAGEVTINMTTPVIEDSDFPSGIDAFLELGFETPLGYSSVLSNDDGGEGLNARIAVDLRTLVVEGGDWLERLRIRASSISGGGGFALALVQGLQEVAEEVDFSTEEEVGADSVPTMPPPAAE
ncbi:PPC domain-containing protein [Alteraurantiacibacter palmitatis]|uniref:PPC domain-containing protein n=1 Tax=Alteraurantiacibacter palmitatis TaxID=2054628 RepID=A0ABV7E4D5_9SPHN